jgi:hypothetical protein
MQAAALHKRCDMTTPLYPLLESIVNFGCVCLVPHRHMAMAPHIHSEAFTPL